MNYIYCRISTTSQNETSLEVQENVCRSQIKNTDETIVVKDVGSGRSTEQRPNFIKMISNLKEGDNIYVYDQSRLSRDAAQALYFFTEIQNRGANLYSNGKLYKADNPNDKVIFTTLAGFAEYQRGIQKLKSMEGTRKRFENGNAIFTGKLLGYSLSKKRNKPIVEIVEKEADIVRYIFNETIKGKSIVSISNELWNNAVLERDFSFYVDTVRSILRRPIYMGYYSLIPYINSHMTKYTEQEFRDSLVKSNYYPPIISEEDWWKAYYAWNQNVIRHRDTRSAHNELSGVYRCEKCHRGIAIGSLDKRRKVKSENYSMGSHSPDCGCKRNDYGKDWLERITRLTFYITFSNLYEVGAFFKEQEEKLYQSNKEIFDALTIVQNEIAKLEKKKSNVVNAIAEGVITLDDSRTTMEDIKSELHKYTEKMNRLNEEIKQNEIEAEEFVEEETKKVLDDFDSKRRFYYLKYIKNAVVKNDGNLEIEYFNGKVFKFGKPKRHRTKIDDVEIAVSCKNEEQEKIVYNFQDNKVKVMFNINMEVQTKSTLKYLRDGEREEEDYYNEVLNGEDI